MPLPSDERAATAYSGSPLRGYDYWRPRVWHGMTLGTWLRLLRGNRFAVSPSRWPMAAGITATAALNSFAWVFAELLFGHVARHTRLAAPPLFVLGHWRSGTTLLHELLILDPRHTYPNTFECFAPHHFLWTEWWITSWTQWTLPGKRPMDDVPMGWDRPQEDEFALCNLGVPSPYLVWAFPNHGPVAEDYLDLTALPAAEREHWKRTWREFIQRVALMRNRRIVLKSPTHTARVRTLLEVFPDARFVHIVRDPLALFPSTIRLWKSLSHAQGLQTLNDRDERLQTHVLETFVRMDERFDADRALIPPGRLAELRYEDLIADPVGQLRRVYRELDLGDFASIESAVADHAAAMRSHHPNEYALPPDVADHVRRRWAAYCERYGYG